MDLDSLESYINEFMDIEIYAAEEILKSQGCNESDKNMSTAYMMAINRAKKIISLCIKHHKENY